MAQEFLQPDYHFLETVEAAGPFNVSACYQCRKCTNGCPATFAMDLYPDEVVRYVILGQREKVLHCRTIWVCAACETCTTRCPNGVKIAEMMDCLKEMAVQEGIPCPQPQIRELHETFLENVKIFGRVFESALLPVYMLRSGEGLRKLNEGHIMDDMRIGLEMFLKGKLGLFPHLIKGRKEVRDILTHVKGKK